MNIVPITKSPLYPKYRILYEKIEQLFLDADISTVEAIGILELLKHDIASPERDDE